MSSAFQETNHLASLSSLTPPSPTDTNPSDALANLPPELQQLLQQAAASGDLPKDPAALRDFLANAAAAGGAQQEAQEIIPMKGYVIKTSLAKSSPVYPSGMKMFINVTHSPYVPAPPVATDEEIQRAIADAPDDKDDVPGEADERGKGKQKPAWRVPMSLSDVRDDLDKAGRPCLVVDALVNTSVVHKSEHAPDFRAFVVELALAWVEAKHKLSVSREYTIPHLTCKGDPVPHVIYRAKRAGIAESDAVKQTPMYRVRRSAAAAAAGAARQVYTVTVQLPLLYTADKLDVQVEERKVLVDHPLYSAVIPLSCVVDVDGVECDAAFDKSKRELVVKVPIVGPVAAAK